MSEQAAPPVPAAPKRSPSRVAIKLGLAAVLLGAAGYLFVVVRAQPTIGDIVTAPKEYVGREVSLRGVVTDVVDVPMVAGGGYRIMDEAGDKMLVVGGELPSQGDRVKIRGTVRMPVESRLATLVYVQVGAETAR